LVAGEAVDSSASASVSGALSLAVIVSVSAKGGWPVSCRAIDAYDPLL